MIKIPWAVMADSYKAPHHTMYKDAERMVVYGEFRGPFNPNDHRIIAYGIRYIVEEILNHQWTHAEVSEAKEFYDHHNVGGSSYPWPEHLFRAFIDENNGYFPVTVKAMPEASVIYPHIPVYQLITEGKYAPLGTFLETVITHYWYPSTVATKSRHAWQILKESFDRTVDPEFDYLLGSRLHDFGYRGTTCNEQALIGGSAHLLNFEGSDTMIASYYVQKHLNNNKPVACSIPATEHSVMMSYRSEQEAVEHSLALYGQYGFGLVATVADTYNYDNFLNVVVPTAWEKYKDKVGLWVVRPDSGDPVLCVMKALKALAKICGYTTNSKSFKVINHAATIQGDGIDIRDIERIIKAVENEGFSIQNVAFGMGAGLLQKINRDTMKFATKLCSITYKDGTKVDVMKKPASDNGKTSIPGETITIRTPQEIKVCPAEKADAGLDEMIIVYDRKPVNVKWPTFDEMKTKLTHDWLAAPKTADVFSQELKDKIEATKARIAESLVKV